LLPDLLSSEFSVTDDLGGIEADQFQRLSGWAGHAGPISSYPYINQYEEPLLALTSVARPSAWAHGPSAEALEWFSNLAEEHIAPSKFAAAFHGGTAVMTNSVHVGLGARVVLTGEVGEGIDVEYAAARAYLDTVLAEEVMQQVHEAMEIAKMLRRQSRTPEAARRAIQAFGPWTEAAKAVKLTVLRDGLEALIREQDLISLRALFESWRQVRVDEQLAMDDGYASIGLLRRLQSIGLPRACMFIKSRIGAPPLHKAVEAMGLRVIHLKARPGKVQHWLQFTEPGVDPDDGAGKQVSSTGFHWLMVLVASWLLSVGELKWS
jgi:hypothetical protein